MIFEQHIRLKLRSCASKLDQDYAVIYLKIDGCNNKFVAQQVDKECKVVCINKY